MLKGVCNRKFLGKEVDRIVGKIRVLGNGDCGIGGDRRQREVAYFVEVQKIGGWDRARCRKVAHREPVEVVPRVPLEEQSLPRVVINEEGGGHEVIFPHPESVTISFGDNMDAWSEKEVDFVSPLDVIQPDEVHVLLNFDAIAVENKPIDSNEEYLDMLLVIGTSINASYGKVLETIKERVEVPMDKNIGNEITEDGNIVEIDNQVAATGKGKHLMQPTHSSLRIAARRSVVKSGRNISFSEPS
ncbi:hypothetical protein AMTR_s00012p00156030 [Amborella trichopoda]|uniref:Uncharacterized protein n=1 Tax=Amborella trichopoda TaxID=13333 RepID=W1PKZ4_AMBTC|nr:hypothetical protein AMTR_s00012p00156030 [Amborella trichopoda]